MQFEVTVTLFIQSLGLWLAEPMKFFSFLGTEQAFMVLLPFVYWCVDAGLGLKMGAMLILTNSLNGYLKLAFHSPRPYWFDANVKALSAETSFGFPSGHAQTAASLWGLLAFETRHRARRWLTWAAVALIFLIGFSRLYLGVHFLRDVLAGWLLGGVLVWLFSRVSEPVTGWVRERSLPQQVGMALVSSVMLVVIQYAVLALLTGWELPAAWLSLSAAAAPDNPIDPLSVHGIFTVAGTWLGLSLGAAWFYHKVGGFNTQGTPAQLILRYLIGIAGVAVLYLGLSAIFPHGEDLISQLLRLVRYALIALWVSAGAPFLFIKLRLAGCSWVRQPVLARS